MLRLPTEMRDQIILLLDPVICAWPTTYRVHHPYILWTSLRLVNREVVNKFVVDSWTREDAKIAIDLAVP